jgi:hypothetical protein
VRVSCEFVNEALASTTAVNFIISSETVGFSRRTLLGGVTEF